MSTLEYTDVLTIVSCGADGCGIAHAIPEELYRKARRSSVQWWWCPNGHKIHYSESEFDQVSKEKAEVERRLEAERRRTANAQEDARAARASLIATKGHLTRQRQRAARALCPVPGCKRHFVNVQRHVEGQHPEWVEAHR